MPLTENEQRQLQEIERPRPARGRSSHPPRLPTGGRRDNRSGAVPGVGDGQLAAIRGRGPAHPFQGRDVGLSQHIGLNGEGARIISQLFRSSPAHSAAPIVVALILAAAGTMAVADSLKVIYERVFGQQHPAGETFSDSSAQ